MEHRATHGTHSARDYRPRRLRIRKWPVDGPSRKQHLPEVYGDLAEWSTGTLPACLWIAACFNVLSTIAYCSTQTSLAVEVPCQTVLKVFSAMLHML
jgi:hypothetical protein